MTPFIKGDIAALRIFVRFGRPSHSEPAKGRSVNIRIRQGQRRDFGNRSAGTLVPMEFASGVMQ